MDLEVLLDPSCDHGDFGIRDVDRRRPFSRETK